MEPLRLVGQHDQMHERVGVDDEEKDRARKKKASSGSSILRNGSLTGSLEKEIGVRHRAGGDREIEQHEQIGEPQAPADRGRVVDRLLDRRESSALAAIGGRSGAGGLRTGTVEGGAALTGAATSASVGGRPVAAVAFSIHGLLPQ